MSTRTGFGRAVRRSSRRSAVSFFALLLLFSLGLGQGTGLIASAGGLGGSLSPASGGQKVTDLAKSSVKTSSTSAAKPAAVTAAAGSLNVDLDQWANAPSNAWQNGNLNQSNSSYQEGLVVPFRYAIEGLAAGTHSVHINYDFTAGGHEAYDFLATYNATEPATLCSSGGGAVSSMCPSLPAPVTHAFPSDPFSPGSPTHAGLPVSGAETFAAVGRNLTMYGGTIDSITGPTHAGPTGGNSTGDFVVTFTTTGSAALFAWGGHLAQSAYWHNTSNGPNGSGTISGSPWHMRTQQLDGSGNKNQDRSIAPFGEIPLPNVSVLKVADDSTITAGDTAGFTITVTNDGPGAAANVTLNDTLPAGVTWTETPDLAACSITAGVLSCSWASLAEGQSIDVHVSGVTDAADCGVLTNTATVAALNEGDDATDNSSTATITVDCPPGISITKVADDPSVDAANQIGFTITVTNAGPGTATDVTVTDTLPTNDGLDWSIDLIDGQAPGPNPPCAIAGGVLTCDFGDMGVGSHSVHITSDTDATTCGTVDNTATVTISNGPGDEASDSVDVNCPDLGIDIEKDGPALAHVGGSITYTFTVTLTTPETLFDVVVSDPNCDEGAPVYVSGDTNDNQALEAGEVWNYTCTHVVTEDDPDPLPNTATVEGTADDGRSASDEDSHSVDLIHPDILIIKTVNPQSGEPGDTVTYTYEVTNTGDTTLFDISVDDDVIGHIGDIDQLKAGESATLTKDFVLPDQQGDLPLVNVGTATGTDVLGTSVSDEDNAGVTILRAENPPTPPPPTAFTGSNAERLGLFAAGLLALGLLALALGRRRRGGQTV
jgi:uncharacterized repeat protein (TIGR01451 family)